MIGYYLIYQPSLSDVKAWYLEWVDSQFKGTDKSQFCFLLRNSIVRVCVRDSSCFYRIHVRLLSIALLGKVRNCLLPILPVLQAKKIVTLTPLGAE